MYHVLNGSNTSIYKFDIVCHQLNTPKKKIYTNLYSGKKFILKVFRISVASVREIK